MKQRAPAFQFYPRQFAGDDQVMGMDLEAVGSHILLMCAAASSPDRCRIDADEYAIRMRLRNPADEAGERIKKQLLGGAGKLSADGNWWVQDGLQRTFQKQKEFSEQQSRRANARWGNNDAGDVPNSCRNDAGEMPEGVPEGCSSSSSSSSKTKTSSSEHCSDGVEISSQKKTPKAQSKEASRLAALLKAEILRNKADYRITPAQERKWAVTAERMLRLDGRTPEQIADLIRWVQQNDFWMCNVVSMDTLREKFDQLELKRGKSPPSTAAFTNQKPVRAVDEARRLLAVDDSGEATGVPN